MGTSSSSDGSPSNVSLFPPWTPPPLPPEPSDADQSDAAENPNDRDDNQENSPPPLPNVIAPAGRFFPARVNLNSFANSGSRENMRRGLGHYVHKGLQGSKNAVQRFGGTTRSAGTLYGVLSGLSSGESQPDAQLDRALLTGRSAREIVNAIIEAVRPIDGSQDTEAAREAMQRALSAVLERFPDADLLDLTEEQRLFATEQYLALDAFNRVWLDLGKATMESAPSAASALARMKEVREYIRETIAARFRKLRAAAGALTARKVSALAAETLVEAFRVFEVSAI
jgi:hypothetical protein